MNISYVCLYTNTEGGNIIYRVWWDFVNNEESYIIETITFDETSKKVEIFSRGKLIAVLYPENFEIWML